MDRNYKHEDSNMEGLFSDMIRKGLVATSSTWLEKAVEQRHPRVSIGLASSQRLHYDKIEKMITILDSWN